MELSPEFFAEMGYPLARQLPTGEWIGIQKMFYTTGLFVGLDASGYASRFCYEHTVDAVVALYTWDGLGDPPGPWIKHKGGRIHDRTNPERGYKFRGIPIIAESTTP